MSNCYAIERINEQNLCDLKMSFDAPATVAESIRGGEVISVTSKIGLASKQFVVLSNQKSDVGKNKIVAKEYDEAVFSDEIVGEPSTPDTSLPSPTDVAPVTDLTVKLFANKLYTKRGAYFI